MPELNQQIIETSERIITSLIQDFLVKGTESDEETDLVFETISTLDGLIEAVQEC